MICVNDNGGVLQFRGGIRGADRKQTVKGAVNLLEGSGNNPEVEIDKVSTPGGLTIKGLNAMDENGFTHAVLAGILEAK